MAKLGDLIGGDADETGTALDAAGPALLGGLAERVSGDDGGDVLTGMLDDADSSILDDVGGFLDGGDADAGGGMLDGIFGDDRGGLLDGLASESGLGAGMFGKLLPMLAPLLMGSLAKLRSDDDLDADALVGRLAGEREDLEKDGKLGDWFGGVLKGGGALGALGGAAALAKGKLGDAKDAATDKVSDAKDAAGDAKDAATDKVSDAKDAATGKVDDAKDAAGDAKDAAAGKVTGAKDAAADKTAGATAAVGGKLGGAKDAADSTVTRVRDDDDRSGGGLGWLWWAIGAILLVLFLAWLLNQCGSDDETDAGGATTEAAADDDADADADDADEDPTTTEAAADDDADDADEDPTTTEAPADDADPAVDLQAEVDGVLGDGVTGAVDGDVVTLTGTVDSEDAKTAAEEAVTGIEGVGSVDNQIEVAEAEGDAAEGDDAEGDEGDAEGDDADEGDAAAPAGGASLNDELGLEPITFAYRSADITAEGQTVLAEVIAYLEANDVNIQIQGHTDSDGSEAENIALSTARAESVMAYLEGEGVDAGRMNSVGLGEAEPKVPNDTADNKAINRRIEFVVEG